MRRGLFFLHRDALGAEGITPQPSTSATNSGVCLNKLVTVLLPCKDWKLELPMNVLGKIVVTDFWCSHNYAMAKEKPLPMDLFQENHLRMRSGQRAVLVGKGDGRHVHWWP